MGIRGLLYYTKENSPGACYNVDLRAQAKRRVKQGLEPVIVVDLLNCSNYIYGDLDWICGGQFREHVERVGAFLAAFNNAGIRLVFIADGQIGTEDKRDVWVRRRYESLNKIVYPVYNSLKQGNLPILKDSMLPTLMTKLILKFVFNIDVRTSVREADDDIAEAAKSGGVLGILAQDSDYLIYQTGVPLLSVQDLSLHTLNTTAYDGGILARNLGIRRSQLPLFAILAGNDKVDREKLRQFHCSLVGYQGDRYPYMPKVFSALGNYIRRSRARDHVQLPELLRDLEWIGGQVFHDPTLLGLLQDVLKGYFLVFKEDKEDDILSKEDDLKKEGGSRGPEDNWREILKLFRNDYIRTLSTNHYPVLIGRPYESCTALEDYRESHRIPPYALLWESSRRRVYGILLKEKPGAVVNHRFSVEVGEWCMSGPESIDDITMTTPEMPPDHPGLLFLHRERSEEGQAHRWKLFTWAVHPDLDYRSLQSLEPGEVALVCILFKFQHERENPILEGWEVKVFILVYYLLQSLTLEYLKGQGAVVPTPRGAHLVTLFTRTYLMDINTAVGRLLPVDRILNFNLIDGKLFQRLHFRCKEESLTSLVSEFGGTQDPTLMMAKIEKIANLVQ